MIIRGTKIEKKPEKGFLKRERERERAEERVIGEWRWGTVSYNVREAKIGKGFKTIS